MTDLESKPMPWMRYCTWLAFAAPPLGVHSVPEMLYVRATLFVCPPPAS